MISFRVGQRDAKDLEQAFGGSYALSAFTDLANFEIIGKVAEAGQSREAFRGTTLPPSGNRYGGRENILERSRQRYARRRVDVEEKIRRWMA
jgi:hypothetical protein